jgi:16S rRNA (guanine966-N2)-methyltransferase
MRIIAGEFRGRKLLGPEGDQTRPITDRVKQSVFDVLSPRLPDAVVYDLFAGTGSMGLESLSRGSKFASFFETDRSALDLLRENIATLAVKDRATIIAGDLFRWFDSKPEPPEKMNIIFLDPPYRFLTEQPDNLRALSETMAGKYLSPQGVVVFRHDIQDSLDLPPFRRSDVRDYGGMRVEFLGL